MTTARGLLALDTSTHRVGYCRWTSEQRYVAGSEWLGGSEEPVEARWRKFALWLDGLLQLEHPGRVVAEVPDLEAEGLRTTPDTLLALYGAYAVVVIVCSRYHIPVERWDARDVRERVSVTGRRTAPKEEVWDYLRLRGFRLPMRGSRVDHDAADALGLAVAWADQQALVARASGMGA